MKLVTLINSVESLNKLMETKLPAKTSFKLSRFAQKLNPEVEAYYKLKNEKLKEYGTPLLNEDGSPETDEKGGEKFKFEKEAGEKFIAEMQATEETEVTIEVPEIKIEDLGDISIEPKYLSVLEWLVKE